MTRLVCGLADRGHDVHVSYQAGGPNLSLAESAGVHLHALGIDRRHDPRLLMRLVQVMRAVRPDVVHTWLPQMDIAAAAAGFVCRLPVVVSEPSSDMNYQRGWKRSTRELLGRHAAAIIANSAGGVDYWVRSGANPRRCVLIPSGIPLDQIKAAEPVDVSKYGFANSRIILAVSRFDNDKNIGTLVEVLRQALRDSRVAVVVCGNGPRLDEVRIAMRGESRVLIPGFVHNVFGWMKSAAAFVSVSRFEGRPNAVLEAMAAGCPVVVSDIPAHREFLDDASAVFAPADDADAFAAVLLNALDDELRPSRALRAKMLAAAWTVTAMIDKHVETYTAISAKR